MLIKEPVSGFREQPPTWINDLRAELKALLATNQAHYCGHKQDDTDDHYGSHDCLGAPRVWNLERYRYKTERVDEPVWAGKCDHCGTAWFMTLKNR